MEWNSCHNVTNKQNMFYKCPTIHTQTQCGLQIQNIIHKLMQYKKNSSTKNNNSSTIFFFKYKLKSFTYKTNPPSTKNNSTSTKNFWHNLTTVTWLLAVSYHCHVTFGSNIPPCRFVHEWLLIHKCCAVIRPTRQQVALLSQVKAAKRSFWMGSLYIRGVLFLALQAFIECKPTVYWIHVSLKIKLSIYLHIQFWKFCFKSLWQTSRGWRKSNRSQIHRTPLSANQQLRFWAQHSTCHETMMKKCLPCLESGVRDVTSVYLDELQYIHINDKLT